MALYSPASPEASRTFRFLRRVNAAHGLSLESYYDLYRWSTDAIDAFWSAVWDETGVVGTKGAHVVDARTPPAANPPWFADAALNWAENMLRCRAPGKVALVEASEYPAPARRHPARV